MKNYLLYVTFYAGSDAKEDTDNGLFLLSIEQNIDESEIKNIFYEANRHLCTFNQEDGTVTFPISYESEGLNINGLMAGVEIYTKGKVTKINSNCGPLVGINNCYMIEQYY